MASGFASRLSCRLPVGIIGIVAFVMVLGTTAFLVAVFATGWSIPAFGPLAVPRALGHESRNHSRAVENCLALAQLHAAGVSRDPGCPDLLEQERRCADSEEMLLSLKVWFGLQLVFLLTIVSSVAFHAYFAKYFDKKRPKHGGDTVF